MYKRCERLEEIKNKIKTEFPEVTIIHQKGALLYFDISKSIQIQLTIRTWTIYGLTICYEFPCISGRQTLTITSIEDIKDFVIKLKEYNNIDRDEVF